MALTASEANGQHQDSTTARRRRYLKETDPLLKRLEDLIDEKPKRCGLPAPSEVREAIKRLAADQGLEIEVTDGMTHHQALDAVFQLQWWPKEPGASRLDDELKERPEDFEEPIPLLGYSRHYRENGG